MKRLILTSLTIVLLSNVYGQSTNGHKFPDETDFIPFRSDMRSTFDSIDIKKFIGYWISLNGNAQLKIYQQGDEVLLTGDYFPGVSKQGDKAILTVSKGIVWDNRLQKQIQGYTIKLMYNISSAGGGGGGDVDIAYSQDKDQLIVSKPPYNVLTNGKWMGFSGSSTNAGFYGKEFKRVK